jgi:hypothetical protein
MLAGISMTVHSFRKIARRALLPLILIIGFVLIAFASGSIQIGPLTIRLDCAQRESSEPTAPLYPNSVLLGRDMFWNYESATMIRYDYETQDAPSQVGDFYNGQATCTMYEWTQRMHCSGDAHPFGKYSVYIDYVLKPTTAYSVEVRWDKCSSDWTISVE